MTLNDFNKLREHSDIVNYSKDISKRYTAVATYEGLFINQHLGEATDFYIYDYKNGVSELIDKRMAPEKGTGNERWKKLSEILADCQSILVSGVGDTPKQVLAINNINVYVVEGFIDEALKLIYNNKSLDSMSIRNKKCNAGCSGDSGGCS